MTVSNRPDALIWRSRGFIRPARSPELSAKTKNWYSPKDLNLDPPLIRQRRYHYARRIFWWTWQVLPLPPPHCKCGALLNELQAQNLNLGRPSTIRTRILPFWRRKCFHYTISLYLIRGSVVCHVVLRIQSIVFELRSSYFCSSKTYQLKEIHDIRNTKQFR